jgi:hypothetical protein
MNYVVALLMNVLLLFISVVALLLGLENAASYISSVF